MRGDESGQTLVEFAIISTVLLMMTAGLIDSGRAFYQYNALSAGARYGARWGSVVGGSCALPYGQDSTTTDWCNREQISSGSFWTATGNAPLQGVGTDCPSYSSTPADYYTVQTVLNSIPNGQQPTTIVGAVATKFDSSASSSNFVTGGLTPGFDLSKLEVCIGLSGSTSIPGTGAMVTVKVYYPFDPVSGVLPQGRISMSASSQYEVE